MIVSAPAKLNLTLEVLSRRGDGYHNLRSVMVPVALYDEIEIGTDASGWSFESSDPALKTDNLIERAVRASGIAPARLRVALRKNIPIGAGLGGGSSDAAAVLLAIMDGKLGAAPQADYLAIARSLGSDVPFFLCGTAALVEGSGERVTALGALPDWGATIIYPPVPVATAGAYALLDSQERESRPRSTSVTLRCAEALQRGDFATVNALLQNDFEGVIADAHPEVAQALSLLRAWNGTPAILTGSGSCVFTLWERQAPSHALELPAGFMRFDAAFATTNAWMGAP